MQLKREEIIEENKKKHKEKKTNWSYWCLNLSMRAGAVPADTPETPLSLTLRTRSFWDQ